MLRNKYFLFSIALIILSFSGILIYNKGLSQQNELLPKVSEKPQDFP